MMNKFRIIAAASIVSLLCASEALNAQNSGSEEPFSPEGVYLGKSVTEDPNVPNTYTIDLEAYVTGRSTTIYTISAEPADILLLLDVSDSMEEGFSGASDRMAAMKSAVTNFISSVGNISIANGIRHKIGIITFADKAELSKSLTDISVQSNVNSLISTVNGFDCDGATAADEAFELAYNTMKDRSEKTYVDKDGHTKYRNQIVIYFTDGMPGWGEAVNDEFGGLMFANSTTSNYALYYSNLLKLNGATVYSIGIHNLCNPAANYNFHYVRDERQMGMGEDRVYANKSQGMNAFMHFVSSDYPYDILVQNTYSHNMELYVRNIIVNNGYYLNCNNASTLNEIFNAIGEEITTGGADYTLTETATAVIDIVSESFKLPDNADPSIVSIKVAQCIGVTSTGTDGSYSYNFDTPIVASTLFPGISVTVEDKTVKVTGFNFSENFVGENTYLGRKYPHGYKLIISFPIEIDPSNPGGANVNTNAVGSGMYFDHDGDGEAEQIGGFEFPKVKIPNIVVIKKGLKPGESATFTIHKIESDGTMSQFPIVLVATQKEGADYAIAKAKIQSPGRYKVTESTWSWAYDISGLETSYDKEDSSSITTEEWNAVGFGAEGSSYQAVIPFKFGTEVKDNNSIIRNVNDFTEDEKDGEYKGTLFIFTDSEKENMPAHAETINNNEFYESK